MASFYPGEQGTLDLFHAISDAQIAGVFGNFNLSAPGWVLWVTFLLNLFVFYILAITGVMIGSKVVPTVEEDAVEYFLGSNSISARKYYAENLLAGFLTQIGILIPLYLIISIFTIWVYNSSDALGKITLAFFISLSFGIFFLAISSVSTILQFSKKWGKIIGFGYLIVAFIIDILADSPAYSNLSKLAINQYVSPSNILLPNYDWIPFFVLLGISLAICLIGVWRVKYPDFIEKTKTKQGGRNNPLSGIISDRIQPDSRLGHKFPLFLDQTKLDLRVVVVLLIFITFQQSAIFLGLPNPAALTKAIEQSNSPALSAFAQNHPVQQSLLGFVTLKFYTILWLIYGLGIALIASSIPNRDVRTNTHDIVIGENDITPSKLIRSRILSMIFTFSLLLWISFFILRGLQAGRLNLDFTLQFGLFFVLWIHYLGMAILLVGIAMIPTVNKGRNLSMLVFIFFVIFSFIPFLNSNIEFLKYVSYLSYFDPIGILYGETKFLPSFLISFGMFLGSLAFTYIMTIKRYRNADLR